ncbi:DUF3990 domain-containing protein [Treponema sp.]|uniref:DUF3990 domain-containing protein n=1 Tax=Treponema sp. TaxID=166 RepID=UPI00298E9622|nr:DUF3990 domain-containing protein [Treponema sp.]MCQ2241233.1 DUF3990 domain-containing protein [Treponema sp.]
MKLFHGTNAKFETIDLSKSKDKRDFGKGFYTTTFYEQAEKWAKNQNVRYGGDGSFVKEYEFSEDSTMNVKVFPEMNAEWLEFVKKCRTEGGTPHNYDIIRGPVANDNTMRTIALYISGIYTTEQAIEQLRFFKVNDQVSFHTEKALKCITWKSDKEV